MWSLFRRLDRWPGLSGGRSGQTRNQTPLVIEFLEPRQMTAALGMAEIFPGYQPSDISVSIDNSAIVVFAAFQDTPDQSLVDGADTTIDLDEVADLIGQAFDLDDDELWELPRD